MKLVNLEKDFIFKAAEASRLSQEGQKVFEGGNEKEGKNLMAQGHEMRLKKFLVYKEAIHQRPAGICAKEEFRL